MAPYGLHTLIHATHLVSLGEALVQHVENRLVSWDAREMHHRTLFEIVARRDLASRYRFSVHDDQLLAGYQVARVFQHHELHGVDDDSLQWAERLMLDATEHYAKIAKRGARKPFQPPRPPHLAWPDLE